MLVHAGINHLLCLCLCFPGLSLSDYNLRHTGNRSIEAIHGMFRGGTCSLPITSPNLSFREFLSKMNKAQQMQRAEHFLQGVEGNSIVAAKKKRKTFAKVSKETPTSSSSSSNQEYYLPPTYEKFSDELKDACKSGDSDSKKMIEKLVPQMAEVLKKGEQWEDPDVPLDDVPKNIQIVTSLKSVNIEVNIDDIINKELSAMVSTEPDTATLTNDSMPTRH